MIEVENLTKRFGEHTAVDDLSFEVKPGVVTGFLGPNGAGKSTTMRMVLGLDRPTKGRATINGRSHLKAGAPLREVGALLDAADVHGGRKASAHLKALAQSNHLPASRVDECLRLTGMDGAKDKRIKDFSLGMRQRLGIAAALLGDPPVLLFDEPVNGLDPEGITWIRTFMKKMAGEGRTVLVSSHLMSEMAQTADHVVVIGRGKLLADESTKDLVASSSRNHIRVRSPHADELATALKRHEAEVETVDGHLEIRGLEAAQVGEIAHEHGVVLHELVEQEASLEQAFMEMTRDSVDYRSPEEQQAAEEVAA